MAGKRQLKKILESFVPVAEREWYPWVWKTRDELRKMTPNQKKSYRDHARELALSDFFFFCDEVLRNDEHPHLFPGFHDELCHVIQSGEDIVILTPRNHLKSTISSQAYPLWLLTKNTNARVLIASETQRVARSLMSVIKQNILDNPKFKLLFPEIAPKKEKAQYAAAELWNKEEILVNRSMRLKEPSVLAMSAGQELTGSHFDVNIYDDVVTRKNAKNLEQIQEITDWYEMSLNLMDMGGASVGDRYAVSLR